MEVILRLITGKKFTIGILHVCGGDPEFTPESNRTHEYSPRMWRWSQHLGLSDKFLAVFSTYVEVILTRLSVLLVQLSILHVCGGDPAGSTLMTQKFKYSPRMWRWSYAGRIARFMQGVFSTYVEVIPMLVNVASDTIGILHVCGGDPSLGTIFWRSKSYSPRVWRWSRWR